MLFITPLTDFVRLVAAANLSAEFLVGHDSFNGVATYATDDLSGVLGA